MGYQLLDEVEGDCLRATETKHPIHERLSGVKHFVFFFSSFLFLGQLLLT